MTYLYFFILSLFLIYSYALVDPNFTLINISLWEWFRNNMVFLGYYQRPLSSLIYIILIALLFYFHFYFLKKIKKTNILKLTYGIVIILLVSYPFLSHDFFNYMFDAKILTLYGQNPYLHKALDYYPYDTWLRFMHWTHRTYPYGPVFLGVSLIPSFLSFGKLLLNFIFFKAFFGFFYVLSVYLLNKINKKYALFFATNPLIIVEGLINSHNDLIAVAFGIIGIFYLFKKTNLWSRIFFLLSGGIKYISVPILFLSKNSKSKLNTAVFIGLSFLLIYLSFFQEIQPWYFLNLFLLIAYFPKLLSSLNIFFAGLLLSYLPFIYFGDWGVQSNLNIKHWIIITFFIINLSYMFVYNFSNVKKSHQ
ncbi:MAG: hypothetical protein ABH812_02300 [bacterium]